MHHELKPREINGGHVFRSDEGDFKLLLQKSGESNYSLAQIDNYMHLPRRNFPLEPPISIMLGAKISSPSITGTWGFGLWNDPFSFGFGGGGMSKFLPVLPNAAWFFYGSRENALSLHDDQPGNGFHVKTFRSLLLPSLASLLTLPILPLLFFPGGVRLLRSLARVFIKEDGKQIEINVNKWHAYRLSWGVSQTVFYVDDKPIFSTNLSPRGRLGTVIWIDNQFFHFDAHGKLGFGFLPIPENQWIQIRDLHISRNNQQRKN